MDMNMEVDINQLLDALNQEWMIDLEKAKKKIVYLQIENMNLQKQLEAAKEKEGKEGEKNAQSDKKR